MVVIDTSVIIDHLRQIEGTTLLRQFAEKKSKETLALSTISVQELYEGKSTLDPEKEDALLRTISPLKILPYTYAVAKLAGELARGLKNPVEFADTAIAATAIANSADILTLNKKHFKRFTNLHLLDI